MGSRLNPTSNMYMPINARYYNMPPMGVQHQIFNYNQFPPGGFQHIQPQQTLHNQHNQQMHLQAQHLQAQHLQAQQVLHSQLNSNNNNINNINNINSSNINNISNSNINSNSINSSNSNKDSSSISTGINNISNSSINNTIKESNIPKTNTQYTNFETKNLDLASRYFSECSTKDFIGNKKKSSSVAWNKSGTKIGSGGIDGIIRIWNFDNNANNSNNNKNNSGNNNNNSNLIELKGHDGNIDKISWSTKNNDLLASAGSDKTIKIWDVKSGKCLSTIATSSENIDVRWSPDGSFIIACTNDDYLALIDMSTMKILKNYKFNGEELNQVGWDNNGELMFMANMVGNIETYKFLPKSTTHVKHLKTLYGHTSAIYSMEFDPTGKYFAAGSADSIISLWDIEDMMCIKTFTGFKNSFPCRSISFSFDGQFIASTSYESIIDIYHVESGQQVHSIDCSGVASLSWHPTLPLLAYAPEINENNKDPSIKVFGYHS